MVIGQFSIWLKVLASLKRCRLELNGVHIIVNVKHLFMSRLSNEPASTSSLSYQERAACLFVCIV